LVYRGIILGMLLVLGLVLVILPVLLLILPISYIGLLPSQLFPFPLPSSPVIIVLHMIINRQIDYNNHKQYGHLTITGKGKYNIGQEGQAYNPQERHNIDTLPFFPPGSLLQRFKVLLSFNRYATCHRKHFLMCHRVQCIGRVKMVLVHDRLHL
jgi:hypothetical protein